MFFLSLSNVWSFSIFALMTYIILFFSFLIYMLPLSLSFSNSNFFSKMKTNFYIISGTEVLSFFSLPILYIYLINLLWSSGEVTSWFGHVIYGSFQSKIVYLIIFMFYIIVFVFFSTTYLSSNEIYDFFITKLNFFYWLILIFMANSLFTVIFVIEVLSTLIFLLITTSTFSTSFFYKNVNFDLKIFFHNNTPYTFLQALLFFFWVSLISSLNLFVFLILFYVNVLTLDWYLLEHLFYYITTISSTKDLYCLCIIWFVIIFSIFLKCGIAPLFIWKPTFFKGISFSTITFYIIFFYFFLFLFFINFLIVYFNELFYYYSMVLLLFVILGLFTLLFILCESFFLKTFFAVSSILNSLLVMLSMIATHNVDFIFFL